MAENALLATSPRSASNQVDLLIFPQTQLAFSYHCVFLPVVPISRTFPFSLWTSHFLCKFHWLQQAVLCALYINSDCIWSSIIVFITCHRWFILKHLLPIPDAMVPTPVITDLATRFEHSFFFPPAELWQKTNNFL